MIALATGARKEAILSLTWDQVYIPEPEGRHERIAPYESSTPEGYPFTVLPTIVTDADGKPIHAKRSRHVSHETPVLNFKAGANIKGAYIDFGAGSGNKRRPQIPIGQNWRLINYVIHADRSQPYVISYSGKPLKSLKKGLAEVAKEAGVTKPVTHHTMKRTAITHMVRGGVPLADVAEMVNTTEAVIKEYYNMHRPDLEAALGDVLSIR